MTDRAIISSVSVKDKNKIISQKKSQSPSSSGKSDITQVHQNLPQENYQDEHQKKISDSKDLTRHNEHMLQKEEADQHLEDAITLQNTQLLREKPDEKYNKSIWSKTKEFTSNIKEKIVNGASKIGEFFRRKDK